MCLSIKNPIKHLKSCATPELANHVSYLYIATPCWRWMNSNSWLLQLQPLSNPLTRTGGTISQCHDIVQQRLSADWTLTQTLSNNWLLACQPKTRSFPASLRRLKKCLTMPQHAPPLNLNHFPHVGGLLTLFFRCIDGKVMGKLFWQGFPSLSSM